MTWKQGVHGGQKCPGEYVNGLQRFLLKTCQHFTYGVNQHCHTMVGCNLRQKQQKTVDVEQLNRFSKILCPTCSGAIVAIKIKPKKHYKVNKAFLLASSIVGFFTLLPDTLDPAPAHSFCDPSTFACQNLIYNLRRNEERMYQQQQRYWDNLDRQIDRAYDRQQRMWGNRNRTTNCTTRYFHGTAYTTCD